ncbi:Methyltransferase-like protein 2 [Seminavis robusta]|uniref:tRNA N(3)-methylcytidine methyltransferase n=1 Tax=Seminavis robusta TaxID=568900 RepID=A0A9N8HBB3_9STRA|nr:Methyltransferase-like protein 2 [Seminavis robusta]|eukprot:Sro176_g077580.1 Methyltransferase-like protein 2 (343) ;mRNA; r:93705-94733
MDEAMKKNEMTTGISYYLLFSSNQNSTTSRERTEEEENQPLTFWGEDEWTPQEEAEAETVLQQSRERCSIRSNGVSKRPNAVEDEQAWNRFYSQHQTNFFKDRHYLHKAFPHEFSSTAEGSTSTKRTLVEIGCGVGNALLPLLESNNDTAATTISQNTKDVEWTVYGLDLSKVAIDWLQQDERFIQAAKQGRAHAFVCDISASSLPNTSLLPVGVANVSTLLFCLSAICPGERMVQAVRNVASTLQPNNGVLVFRDYGRYDEAQMKLGTSRNKGLEEDNFYRKHDGTKCYYFTLEDVRDLFETQAGLAVLELKYLRRVYRNRSTNEVRRRVWVQGRFRKVEE